MVRNYWIFAAGFFAGALFAGIGIQAATAKNNPRAEIVSDEKSGIVRVVIDGKDIVVIDNTGMVVDGRIRSIPQVTGAGQYRDGEASP